MEKLTRPATAKGPGDWFVGEVWFDQIYRGEEPSRARVNVVRFAPGAHTAWHTHAMGQTLHVTEGVGLVGTRDGQVIVMRPGDTVHTPPGEWHWHGATADCFMTHLAIWEGTGNPDVPETTWGEHVTDTDYEKAQS
ncbi:quercetin dioxygenase-like cupin family protein [Kribbella sp. VKM Ac-2569]|uniref:(R)-mandelonitrile lyase n=1 Tax=Kribbella sp. VKM Ac-2569 TaxID=2512220 RepID=UPI00102D24A8|nr:cupin domain-containing protein [Kribbella sp. VKM Ac-2569]RZT26740.1 quercetin dioxygenase-like cupin family protein [Kribbella sp. VKM Ac-2569]